MNGYELNFIIPSPARSASFMEFSPDGRFLAVGDQGLSSLHILDKVTGFHPIIAGMLTGEPTALVWETSETFYAGLKNGVFIHYRIDQKANELVEGVVNVSLRDEGFPITAMALDVESKRMVISVGPGVFAFRRIRGTSEFQISVHHSCELTRLEVDFASLHVSQPASSLEEIREPQLPHFRGQFASPQTMCLSSHSAGNI